jgi:YHS domain-containing protein
MKSLISLILVAGFSVSALAQAKTPKELPCPIMKDHKVNVAKATKEKMFADYKGRRYFFCCAGCKPAFNKSPEKFAKSPSIPTPKKA